MRRDYFNVASMFVLQKCSDYQTSTLTNFARLEPPDIQVTYYILCTIICLVRCRMPHFKSHFIRWGCLWEWSFISLYRKSQTNVILQPENISDYKLTSWICDDLSTWMRTNVITSLIMLSIKEYIFFTLVVYKLP